MSGCQSVCSSFWKFWVKLYSNRISLYDILLTPSPLPIVLPDLNVCTEGRGQSSCLYKRRKELLPCLNTGESLLKTSIVSASAAHTKCEALVAKSWERSSNSAFFITSTQLTNHWGGWLRCQIARHKPNLSMDVQIRQLQVRCQPDSKDPSEAATHETPDEEQQSW